MLVRALISPTAISEDVTTWAKFTSTNQTVCQVDDVGKVKVTGNGEGSIVAWYLSKNVVASVTCPIENRLPAATFAKADRRNFIDDHILEKLRQLERAAVAGLLRRRISAPREPRHDRPACRRPTRLGRFWPTVRRDKRDRLIERLLKRPEFVDYWSYEVVRPAAGLRSKAAARRRSNRSRSGSANAWRTNEPWDRFVRELVTARGSTLENGAANFYAMHEDPQDMAETVSMAFLGMSINCARCHDHPLEKWTNDDYYGMANLFARVRGKGWGGDINSGDGDRIIFVADSGELIQPRTGRPQRPRPLDGKAGRLRVARPTGARRSPTG